MNGEFILDDAQEWTFRRAGLGYEARDKDGDVVGNLTLKMTTAGMVAQFEQKAFHTYYLIRQVGEQFRAYSMHGEQWKRWAAQGHAVARRLQATGGVEVSTDGVLIKSETALVPALALAATGPNAQFVTLTVSPGAARGAAGPSETLNQNEYDPPAMFGEPTVTVCNERESDISFGIIRPYGAFAHLAGRWSADGFYRVKPTKCKELDFEAGSGYGNGYISVYVLQSGRWTVPEYSARARSRRSSINSSFSATDTKLCWPRSPQERRQTGSDAYLSCPADQRLKFNVAFWRHGETTKFILYITDSGFEAEVAERESR